eukprot:2903306-Rhodomonas_salina.1
MGSDAEGPHVGRGGHAGLPPIRAAVLLFMAAVLLFMAAVMLFMAAVMLFMAAVMLFVAAKQLLTALVLLLLCAFWCAPFRGAPVSVYGGATASILGVRLPPLTDAKTKKKLQVARAWIRKRYVSFVDKNVLLDRLELEDAVRCLRLWMRCRYLWMHFACLWMRCGCLRMRPFVDAVLLFMGAMRPFMEAVSLYLAAMWPLMAAVRLCVAAMPSFMAAVRQFKDAVWSRCVAGQTTPSRNPVDSSRAKVALRGSKWLFAVQSDCWGGEGAGVEGSAAPRALRPRFPLHCPAPHAASLHRAGTNLLLPFPISVPHMARLVHCALVLCIVQVQLYSQHRYKSTLDALSLPVQIYSEHARVQLYSFLRTIAHLCFVLVQIYSGLTAHMARGRAYGAMRALGVGVSPSEKAHLATRLRACSAMSGTDLAYGDTGLRDAPSTDLAYAATCVRATVIFLNEPPSCW